MLMLRATSLTLFIAIASWCKLEAQQMEWFYADSFSRVSTARDVNHDRLGNVYTCNCHDQTSSNTDTCFLTALDEQGQFKWKKQMVKSMYDNIYVRTDTLNNAYVSYRSVNGGLHSFWVLEKYNTAGNQIWKVVVDSVNTGYYNTIIDTDNYNYFIGQAYLPNSSVWRWIVRKINPIIGNVMWSRSPVGYSTFTPTLFNDNEHLTIVCGTYLGDSIECTRVDKTSGVISSRHVWKNPYKPRYPKLVFETRNQSYLLAFEVDSSYDCHCCATFGGLICSVAWKSVIISLDSNFTFQWKKEVPIPYGSVGPKAFIQDRKGDICVLNYLPSSDWIDLMNDNGDSLGRIPVNIYLTPYEAQLHLYKDKVMVKGLRELQVFDSLWTSVNTIDLSPVYAPRINIAPDFISSFSI